MTHQKRLSAPKHYPIERKNQKYITTTTGSRSPENSLPALLFLREVANYADTKKEAKQIIKEGKLLRNQEPIKDVKEGLGALDTIRIPEAEKTYRIVPQPKELKFLPINTERHLAKVTGKTSQGDHFVYHLHNGGNIASEDNYDTNSTLVIEDGEIQQEIPAEEGQLGLIIQGKHAGKTGKIEKIQKRAKGSNTVTIENGEQLETRFENVLAITDDIKVNEE